MAQELKGGQKLIMISYVVFIFFVIRAIWNGYCGNIGLCLLEIVFALLNLPYSIKWIKETIGS